MPSSDKASTTPSPAAQKALERFIRTVPPEVANTFSEQQLDAILHFLDSLFWKRHPIDLRTSVPFLFKRFYIVLIAGSEKRSPQRLRDERDQTPIWTTANILLFLFLTTTGLFIFSAGILISRANLSLPSLPNKTFPTIYPSKENEEDCEESGRTWRDGKCYDYEHSPDF